MTTEEQLRSVFDQAQQGHRNVLDLYAEVTDLLVDTWVADDWVIDEATASAITDAIDATASYTGLAVALTRRFLLAAAAPEDQPAEVTATDAAHDTGIPTPRDVLRESSRIGLALWDAGFRSAAMALNSTTGPEPNEFVVTASGDLEFEARNLRPSGDDPLPADRAVVIFTPPSLGAADPRPVEVVATPIAKPGQAALEPGTYLAEVAVVGATQPLLTHKMILPTP